MSIGNRVFVHDTATIKITRSLADDSGPMSKDTWDILITDERGDNITIYCWGDNAILTGDLTGENV
tara:strand:- start:795 stop:992 length:198 start_codon:yes stop_codon:yes gene_type:complete